MKYLPFILFLLLPTLALADTSFVPLTNTPFIEQAGNAVDLRNMLDQLYRLCIGVAAVVAVLQIMRAGIMYMGGDSVTEKKEAKNLIALSIGGIILVLSPVIVFSVINPDILSLKIDGIENLRSTTTPSTPVAVCSPACGQGEACVSGSCVPANTEGDGTCSTSCNTGLECRAGSCVAFDAGSCTTIGNGASVPSVREQNCCAAQTGCQVQYDFSLRTAATCSCTQPTDEDETPPDPEGPQTPPTASLAYGYRIFVERLSGGAPFMYTSNTRFTSSEICRANMESILRDNRWTISGQSTAARQCNCFTPLSEQPGC